MKKRIKRLRREMKTDIRRIISPHITALGALRQPSHTIPRSVPTDGMLYLLRHSVGIPAGYVERQRRRRSAYKQVPGDLFTNGRL
jgi:hypothetical protein